MEERLLSVRSSKVRLVRGERTPTSKDWIWLCRKFSTSRLRSMEKIPFVRTVMLFQSSCIWRRVLVEPKALILMALMPLWLRLSFCNESKWTKELLSNTVNLFSANDSSRRDPRPLEKLWFKEEIRFLLRSSLSRSSRRKKAPSARTPITLSFRRSTQSFRVAWKARGVMEVRLLWDRSSCSVDGGREMGRCVKFLPLQLAVLSSA